MVAAAARAARRPPRARPASPLRDRRIGVAAGRHPHRAAGRSLRPAAAASAVGLRHLAAAPTRRSAAASSAGSPTSSTSTGALPRRRGPCQPAAGRRQPERRAVGYALAALGRRSLPGQRSDGAWRRLSRRGAARADRLVGGRLAGAERQRRGRTVRVRARMVVDASGPRGFLSRALGIDDRGFDGYPGTQALFSHFTGVRAVRQHAGVRLRRCRGRARCERRIRWTTPRCITSSTAAGCGCCGSATASPARASR